MESKYGSRRKPSSNRGFLLATLASFVIGGLLTGYVVLYNIGPQETAESTDAEPASTASPTTADTGAGSTLIEAPSAIAQALRELNPENPEETAEAVITAAEQTGSIEGRMTSAETKINALTLLYQEAESNAARLERLLIAFAARRLVERGDELGDLAQQLRLRFGDERPNAVGTIIDFSRRQTPLRIDTLVARLDGLGPELVQDDSGPSWQAFRRELSSLFVVRRKSTPSPQADQRLPRARQALEQGRIESAIQEIKAMPGAANAAEWIADAEEFKRVTEALDNIELAAVLSQTSAIEDELEDEEEE